MRIRSQAFVRHKLFARPKSFSRSKLLVRARPFARTKTFAQQVGMTLIESVLVIVLIGTAMLTLTSLLFPNITHSAAPHYQSRAIALGQSFMSQILSRGFDENSDFEGSFVRCGESGIQCTSVANLGITAAEKSSGQLQATHFNDVDDFIGCWYTATTQADCSTWGANQQWSLQDVLGQGIKEDFANFRVEVRVYYDDDLDGQDTLEVGTTMKRVEMTIIAGGYGQYQLHAYKGNY